MLAKTPCPRLLNPGSACCMTCMVVEPHVEARLPCALFFLFFEYFDVLFPELGCGVLSRGDVSVTPSSNVCCSSVCWSKRDVAFVPFFSFFSPDTIKPPLMAQLVHRAITHTCRSRQEAPVKRKRKRVLPPRPLDSQSTSSTIPFFFFLPS